MVGEEEEGVNGGEERGRERKRVLGGKERIEGRGDMLKRGREESREKREYSKERKRREEREEAIH